MTTIDSIATKQQRILLVEDDQSLALWISNYLQNRDYQVNIVAAGDKALDCIYSTPPDLVILDINLPGINGMEVCKRAR